MSQNISRRGFLKSSSVASMALFFSTSSTLFASSKDSLLGFKATLASSEDNVIVPDGYEAKVLVKWGDPLFKNALKFDEGKNITKEYAKNATKVFGDDNDGMQFYQLDGDKRALLVVNQEYVNPELMFKHNGLELSAQDVIYMQNSCGVTVLEIEQNDNSYQIKQDSPYNRRITALTPMVLTGPVKGDEAVKTANDEKGEFVLGTFNNCGCGKTPWGTYLTCEENFDDFFGSKDTKAQTSESFKRYGIKPKSVYGWEKFDDRFDFKINPNEPNRHGYIVEFDPYNPNFIPKKRTALGRFKHENAEVIIADDGRVVVYSGDDEVDEFVYKFVSSDKFNKDDLSKNADILDNGTLYVARFDGKNGEFKGKLTWLELTYGKNGLDKENGFKSQADILINVRLAATKLGATPMDRCEWIAAQPNSKAVYATFTNNKTRQTTDAANPREKNRYGQILKWEPKDGNHASSEFEWATFALAGNPAVKDGLYKGSSNITVENMFNSPDGLKFDKFGRLWIQTDGDYSNQKDYKGMGNNQMLCADPNTGEIRRFLTGPVACEITGLCFSEDSKTMFVGVQHPGEALKGSHWPEGGDKTPKSAVLVITKKDGGVIGA
ncbi:twin-arginine translocation pathway signal [Campylobacter geochelonis]|uniref:Twin-arginine translocation pathway signal n=1 Tax=Campylobacter geochelonis TaxID=1780362 RepID=A0A128EIG7_9BACT|nr:phosphatase, PhoX family (DUF839 domain) [Campylobacter geochelonis]CZE48644.1 twin-arginine translocation pathway signal [Campylobacter geochelonis]CZE48754.1 twin-arginine translocation pathway signal [Campylobacter geochelonis]